MNKDRIPPKKIARKISKLLRKQKPDPHYLKKVFEYIRNDLNIKGRIKKQKRLPELLTEKEMNRFYEIVWNSENPSHMIIVKLLLYTGVRNAELVNIRISDVDLKTLRIRIEEGKGGKDRYVPIPKSFKGELTQYIASQKNKNAEYLFETNRKTKMTTRWLREILKQYAIKAGIEKRIYPHLFRHQLLTFLTKKGLVDAKIQLISGHTDKQSLAIYQDLSLSDIEGEYQKAMEDFPLK
jgi:integrase/recombinase XerD